MSYLCQLLVILVVVATSSATLITNLTIIPETIKNGFTRTTESTFICSIADTGTAFSNVDWLAIAKYDGGYTILVEAEDSSATATFPVANPDWSAVVDLDGSSFLVSLTLTITNPVESDAGRYACFGSVQDGTRVRPIFVDVDFEDIDVDLLVDKIENLEGQLNATNERIDNLPGAPNATDFQPDIDRLDDLIDDLRSLINNNTNSSDALNGAIALLNCELTETNKIVQRIDSDLFYYMGVYLGSEYHMSIFSPVSFQHAEDSCKQRNGTLIEFNTQAEFDFLHLAFELFMNQDQQLLTGLMRNSSSGDYILRSGDTGIYTNFFTFGEDGADVGHHCVALAFNKYGEPGLKMDDVNCDFLNENDENNFIQGFVCESPFNPVGVCDNV